MDKTSKQQRGEQLFALRRLMIPEVEAVSCSAMKAVLRCIDDHAGIGGQCWASTTTISEETNLHSDKTVRRALAGLKHLGYITAVDKIGRPSTLTINWSNIPTPVATTGVGQIDTPVATTDTPVVLSRDPGSLVHNPGSHYRRSDRSERKKRQLNEKPLLSKLSFDEVDVEISKWMYSKILEVAPKVKQPSFEKWANTIRLMRVADNHDPEEIRTVFEWANQDSFWKVNILSPDKLRKQFVTLDAKCRSKKDVFGDDPHRPFKRHQREHLLPGSIFADETTTSRVVDSNDKETLAKYGYVSTCPDHDDFLTEWIRVTGTTEITGLDRGIIYRNMREDNWQRKYKHAIERYMREHSDKGLSWLIRCDIDKYIPDERIEQ